MVHSKPATKSVRPYGLESLLSAPSYRGAKLDFRRFPSSRSFLKSLRPTPLHISLTAHIALEAVLDIAIAESFERPEEIDLERFRFPQKVDLAVALGVIPPDSRAPYDSLNRVRNDFSHRLTLTLDARRASQLLRSLSRRQRALTSPASLRHAISRLAIVQLVVTVLYRELRQAIIRRREIRLRSEARQDIHREALATANFGTSWGLAREAEERDLRKRVAEKKRARGYDYLSPKRGAPWDPLE
jgi:hypothetical protein